MPVENRPSIPDPAGPEPPAYSNQTPTPDRTLGGGKTDGAEWLFAPAMVALCLAVVVIGTTLGMRLEQAGMLSVNSWLFGYDSKRVVADISVPGANDRSNVHPLFVVFFKPPSLWLQRHGMRGPMTAILFTAMAIGLTVVLFGYYGRARGLPCWESFLLAALLAVSASGAVSGVVIDTRAYAMLSISVIILMGAAGMRVELEPKASRTVIGFREAGWLAAGIVAYGITISNGLQAFIHYLAGHLGRRVVLRATIYGAVVLALGLAASYFSGAIMEWTRELWVVTPAERGGSLDHPIPHLLANFLLFSVVAPLQNMRPTPNPGLEGEWVLIFNDWNFSPLGWLLCAFWVVLLVWGVIAAWRDPQPGGRRLSAALAACFVYNMVFHYFYYVPFEGTWLYTPNTVASLVGLLVPLFVRMGRERESRRWIWRGVMVVFIGLLGWRHYQMLHGIPELFRGL